MTRRRLALDVGILLLVAAIALAARTWAIGIYFIPSESMLPGLVPGDIVLVEKWPFVLDRTRLPKRGEVVVFKAPPANRRNYVKRVIGLPGDRVALRHGRLILNGREVPRWRIADLLVPATPATPCRPPADSLMRRERQPDGSIACRYPRYREMPADDLMWEVLDLGMIDADDFATVVVPPGHLFVLGDNRDQSADSRGPAGRRGAVGMVPAANLVGRAGAVLLSLDGTTALWGASPWRTGIRWSRIGAGF